MSVLCSCHSLHFNCCCSYSLCKMLANSPSESSGQCIRDAPAFTICSNDKWQLVEASVQDHHILTVQAGEVITGLLEYQEAVTMTRAASRGLAVKTEYTAANTPASPIQHVKPPQIFNRID